jgi:hypothetical protein
MPSTLIQQPSFRFLFTTEFREKLQNLPKNIRLKFTTEDVLEKEKKIRPVSDEMKKARCSRDYRLVARSFDWLCFFIWTFLGATRRIFFR